jgi:16S rRNA (cytosine1402-N4)-methyltransferase
MPKEYHIPAMLNEVISYLNLSPGKIVVDATIGTAGHAKSILGEISPGGRLIGIDRDEESLGIARERLKDLEPHCDLVYGNFSDLDTILKSLNVKKADSILFDLGLSSFQLRNPQRGFSFQNEGPLDMRLDRNSYIAAYDLINNLNEEEISSMLWTFGQERWHNRIAHLVREEREKHPITTTRELADLVVRAIPYRYRYRHYRIHPATRTFQAVRIAVNRELEVLEVALDKALEVLSGGGRICVISFHSLEDRIVKLAFKKAALQGKVKIITPKPLGPSFREIEANPLSRSAKLRVAQRL